MAGVVEGKCPADSQIDRPVFIPEYAVFGVDPGRKAVLVESVQVAAGDDCCPGESQRYLEACLKVIAETQVQEVGFSAFFFFL